MPRRRLPCSPALRRSPHSHPLCFSHAHNTTKHTQNSVAAPINRRTSISSPFSPSTTRLLAPIAAKKGGGGGAKKGGKGGGGKSSSDDDDDDDAPPAKGGGKKGGAAAAASSAGS